MLKRILYVLPTESAGGVNVFVRDFTQHFDNRVCVDFLIYTDQKDSDYQKELKKVDNRIFLLPPLTGGNYLRLSRETNAFFRVHAKEYDAVHITYPGLVNLCLKPAKRYGVPLRIIHSLNSRLTNNMLKNRIRLFLIRNYRNYANAYLACSKEAAEYLYGEQMSNDGTVQYFHNAIDCSSYFFDTSLRLKARDQFSFGEKKVFVCAGRFSYQKNLEFAISVFAVIHRLHPDSLLFLIGEGEMREEYEHQIHSLNLEESVKIIPFTKHLNDYFNAGDLLLFPSRFEGLPITVIDAQAAGLPCLMSDTVSKETILTDCVETMSLGSSFEDWAEKSLSMTTMERRDRRNEITAAGYNILEESKRLEEFYLNWQTEGKAG